MSNTVPKRIATAIINSLKGGVVPRIGLGYIEVGRDKEIAALLRDIDIVGDGGAAFRFISGKFGSGKSFLLQTIRNYAMDRGFVVVDADLSPERRLTGNKNQGLATYKELIRNMSTKTKPDGGALQLILEKWITSIKTQIITDEEFDDGTPEFNKTVEKKIYGIINNLQSMVNGFDFAKVIVSYWKAFSTDNDELKDNALKWLRGEYTTKTDAKRELGVSVIISDENWYEYIKLFSVFLVGAGYKGMLMLVDELLNLYKIPNVVSRQYNYEKLLMMYNDTLQGKAQYLGIIMCATPQCVEDTRRGIFSYEALKSRLETGKFTDDTTQDLLSPIIKLSPLTNEDLYVLIEKLANIHANLYSYDVNLSEEDMISFLKMELGRVGAGKNVTPREIIRDFIEVLNVLLQNPDKKMKDLLGDDSGLELSESDVTDSQTQSDFEGFELNV